MGVKKNKRSRETLKYARIYRSLRQGILLEDQIWVDGNH